MAMLPDLAAARVAVVGLGYVGLPLAVEVARHWETVGYDADPRRVGELLGGEDRTGEVLASDLDSPRLSFSADKGEIGTCNVYLIAVPTPVNQYHYPDLEPLRRASRDVGTVLAPGDVVIFESTVYPGATEEICIPELELASGLKYNCDFSVGYSPERVNPGDKSRRLVDIVKLTSGSTPEAAQWIDQFYRTFVKAGTFQASSIRVAEAAKAIENTQRDVNIALVNELAMMFARMGLDTNEVLAAAGSKWNFLPFRPGLVGGHCIGVDPYYLIHKAQEHGYHPELILASRRINNGMAAHVVAEFLGLLAKARTHIVDARILILGIAFKENCPDLRNTQVAGIVNALGEYNAKVDVWDPCVDPRASREELGIELASEPAAGAYDAILVAVPHRHFIDLGRSLRNYLKDPDGVVYDVKRAIPDLEPDGGL